MTTPTKAKRQTDPDVARIRAVKQVAAELAAAEHVLRNAETQVARLRHVYLDLIESAPEALQQTDPTVARIRAVKDAAAKVVAAESAVLRARSRADAARVALNVVLGSAETEAEQAFLRALAGSLAEPPA